MKLVLAFLAVLGLSYALPAKPFGLKDDLDDFLNLIPTEEFIKLYHKYENDPDVRQVVAYLKSKDFAAIMHIIANVEEVQELVDYAEAQGVPVKEFLNKLADHLGLPHWPEYSDRSALKSTRSILDFIKEARDLIDVDAIVAFVFDKLANSEDFQNLYLKISELDYQKLYDEAFSHPEIVELLTRLNELGVDTKKIWEIIKQLFGWSYNGRKLSVSRSLKDDLDDFLNLIPKEKLIELYNKYKNDPDVQIIVAYLKSDEFAAIYKIVADVEEVQDIVDYIEGQGVPIKEILNELADRLGLPHWPAVYSNRFALKSTRSIIDIVNELKGLINLDDVVALVLDKLANSEAFQNLYLKISEVDYQKLYDMALSHQEIVDLLTRLNKLGIDTKKIWEIIKQLFGWD